MLHLAPTKSERSTMAVTKTVKQLVPPLASSGRSGTSAISRGKTHNLQQCDWRITKDRPRASRSILRLRRAYHPPDPPEVSGGFFRREYIGILSHGRHYECRLRSAGAGSQMFSPSLQTEAGKGHRRRVCLWRSRIGVGIRWRAFKLATVSSERFLVWVASL